LPCVITRVSNYEGLGASWREVKRFLLSGWSESCDTFDLSLATELDLPTAKLIRHLNTIVVSSSFPTGVAGELIANWPNGGNS
jgi:hypothetical protein